MPSISLHPSKMRAGERQAALDSLALRAMMLGRSRRNLNLYDPYPWGARGFFSRHPVYEEVIALLSERLNFTGEFDFEKAAYLLTSDPALFKEDDFKLAVRALWKSDRVGFNKGGNEAFRDGFISAIIQHWDSPISAMTSLRRIHTVKAMSKSESQYPSARLKKGRFRRFRPTPTVFYECPIKQRPHIPPS